LLVPQSFTVDTSESAAPFSSDSATPSESTRSSTTAPSLQILEPTPAPIEKEEDGNALPDTLQPPLSGKPKEQDANLRAWNAPYHAKKRPRVPKQTHIFVTVDCTIYSLWQSLLLEHSWEAVAHSGLFTRVVSGCQTNPEKQDLLTRSVLRDNPRFAVYFTPTFDTLPSGKHYVQYNRPNSLWYWLNHTEGSQDDCLVNLDPDMFFRRPLERVSGFRRLSDLLRHGVAAAQSYSYMGQVDFSHFGKARDQTEYHIGPPWMMTRRDWERVLPDWVSLIPQMDFFYRNHDDQTKWIIEMVAYAAALIRLEISVKKVNGIMSHATPWEGAMSAASLIHYCYTWEIGSRFGYYRNASGLQWDPLQREADLLGHPMIRYWHFSKYRVPSDWPGGKGTHPHNILACDGPLMQEMPPGILIDPMGPNDEKFTADMMRIFFKELNVALLRYKDLYCDSAARRGSPEADKRVIRTTHPGYYLSRFTNVSFMLVRLE